MPQSETPMPPSKRYKASVTYLDGLGRKTNWRRIFEATDIFNANHFVHDSLFVEVGDDCQEIVYFLVERETW